MSGQITWGCCREKDGSVTKSVFCLDCREVFAIRACIDTAREAVQKAKRVHVCRKEEA